ncbi:MAG: hypothetical protein IJ689_04535 [Alphaproteobacteria bacterium]|nr:hypothetical protein [Alphaproteobacteria bacterium]
MNKYILMLGVAGVALGSYCAYAGNSATMTVTATIAHDVSLKVEQDLSYNLVIDPSISNGSFNSATEIATGGVKPMPISSYNVGIFTATVEFKVDCFSVSPSSLSKNELTVNGFAVTGGGGGGNYFLDATISYDENIPSVNSYDFGKVTITYNPE